MSHVEEGQQQQHGDVDASTCGNAPTAKSADEIDSFPRTAELEAFLHPFVSFESSSQVHISQWSSALYNKKHAHIKQTKWGNMRTPSTHQHADSERHAPPPDCKRHMWPCDAALNPAATPK